MNAWLWVASTFLLGASSGAGFVGAEACKLCHRAVYESWQETPHRRAILNVPPGREGESCLACHATGRGKLAGVQCEACHGPGSAYSAPEVMIDVEKAVMAGLVLPAADTCRRCHENEEPGHRSANRSLDASELSRFIHDLERD